MMRDDFFFYEKTARMYYSKHHAAERWDLEFGSNTTEKIENSRKKLKTHEAQKLDFSDESFWQWKNYFFVKLIYIQ